MEIYSKVTINGELQSRQYCLMGYTEGGQPILKPINWGGKKPKAFIYRGNEELFPVEGETDGT